MTRDIGYLFCSLHSAPQIAAVKRRKIFACQALRQCFGLNNSLFGQLAIKVSLTNPASVPFGLTMPNNNHLRALHECLSRTVRAKKSTAGEAWLCTFLQSSSKADAHRRGWFTFAES